MWESSSTGKVQITLTLRRGHNNSEMVAQQPKEPNDQSNCCEMRHYPVLLSSALAANRFSLAAWIASHERVEYEWTIEFARSGRKVPNCLSFSMAAEFPGFPPDPEPDPDPAFELDADPGLFDDWAWICAVRPLRSRLLADPGFWKMLKLWNPFDWRLLTEVCLSHSSQDSSIRNFWSWKCARSSCGS